jgi:hypothetical protein
MPSPPIRPTTPDELEALRARTLAELEHQLELRRIDPGEFERRSERVMDAASALELRPLVADLLMPGAGGRGIDPDLETGISTADATPAGGRRALLVDPRRQVRRPARAHTRAPGAGPDSIGAEPRAQTTPRTAERAIGPTSHGHADHDWAVAVMSGSNRSGQWNPAENVTALAIMGGIRLDFREAAFLEGVVTRVSAFCLMGGVEIIVPPDIHVSVAGTGLLGGFGHVSQTAPDPGAPRLHVSGLALMGGIAIKVRELGECAADDDSP